MVRNWVYLGTKQLLMIFFSSRSVNDIPVILLVLFLILSLLLALACALRRFSKKPSVKFCQIPRLCRITLRHNIPPIYPQYTPYTHNNTTQYTQLLGSRTNRRRRQRRSVEERENAGKGWDLRLNTYLAKQINFFLKVLIILSHNSGPHNSVPHPSTSAAIHRGGYRSSCNCTCYR